MEDATIEKLKKIGQKQDRSVGWLIRKAAEEMAKQEKT
jgi:hypothetical protein